MRRILILAIANWLLLASCGGGNSADGPTSTPTNSTSTPGVSVTTQPTRSGGPAVGQVDNADGDARVNGRRANQDLELRARDEITTGNNSSIDFTLTASPRVECKTREQSELQVRPDEQTQLKWTSQNGISYCNVERGTPPLEATFGVDPDIEISVEGTLFGVVDDGTLRVVEGFVTLSKGGATQRLGPHEEVVLASADQPGARGAWQGLAHDDQALVSDLQAHRTPPSPLPTGAEFRQSGLLSSMRDRKAVLVLLDEDAGGEDEDFVWSYFGRLAETWIQSEDVDVQRVSAGEAVTLLQQTPNAVYISPVAPRSSPATATRTATVTATAATTASPSSVPDLGSSPFYIDGGGTPWRIWFNADSAAVVAFGRFTRAILSTGDYFDMYFPLYEVAPPYEALLRLGP